jgi:alkylation response protein AidB-like acyl-CoA dehydrogenase
MSDGTPAPAPASAGVPEDRRSEQLIAAIRDRRGEFEDAGDQAESLRTLPSDTVSTLRSLGLFWLKTPASLGGTPLPPVEFCDVIEELAYADVSTAWAAMIGAGCCGLAAGWLPEAGARRVFAPDARPLPVLAGQLAPRGTGKPAEGGYVVSGRWGFSSGIPHADWLIGAFRADGPGQADADGSTAGTGFGAMIVFVAPKSDAEVIDTWYVAGLQGTGSLDFRMDGVFVPAEMTYQLGAPAVRGGDLFRLGIPAFVSNEVPPLCAGLARALRRGTVRRAAARDHGGVRLRGRDRRRGGVRPVQVRRRPGTGAVEPDAAPPAQRPRRPPAPSPLRRGLRGRRPRPPRIPGLAGGSTRTVQSSSRGVMTTVWRLRG